ncbi:MAG: hypothetical protein HY830_27535 [Actinobacteria bacterium]|nr:hypothetical protein [Actinomycetota bacterium]
MSVTHPAGPTALRAHHLVAGALVWAVTSSLWAVDLVLRTRREEQVLLGGTVLTLGVLAALATFTWGTVLGRRHAWRTLGASLAATVVMALGTVLAWLLAVVPASSDTNPEAVRVIVSALFAGACLVLAAALVLGAGVGRRAAAHDAAAHGPRR